jgi:hypothetical protein
MNISNKPKNKCRICKYIKKQGFPFGFDRKYYIDSEGCFGNKDHITINYCPNCGRLLKTKNMPDRGYTLNLKGGLNP